MNNPTPYTPAQIRSAKIQGVSVEKFVRGMKGLQVAVNKFEEEVAIERSKVK